MHPSCAKGQTPSQPAHSPWFPRDLTLASPLRHGHFCIQQEEEDNNNPHVAKREVGAQGTNKCEGIGPVQVSQTAYAEPGKAGIGEPPCHPGGPGEGLCPSPRRREGSEQYQGSTPSLQTAKNRSERAEKTKGGGSEEDPMN